MNFLEKLSTINNKEGSGNKRGFLAEDIVFKLCKKYNIPVRRATGVEDCGGGKTDLVINGKKVQISIDTKSKRQRKSLNKKEVFALHVSGVDESGLLKRVLSL